MTLLPRYDPDTIRRVIAGALAAEGVPEEVGDAEARLLTDAELQGVPSHGLLMLPRLVTGIRDGRVSRSPNLEVIRNSAAVCVLDGDRGPGRYVGEQGMRAAVERAGRFGIGACLAVNTTHWGRAYAYASLAAREGFIGICATNAIPNMLAPGSTLPILGNNPLAVGVPRGEGLEPVVLDIAMSQASVGRVASARRLGLRAAGPHSPVPPAPAGGRAQRRGAGHHDRAPDGRPGRRSVRVRNGWHGRLRARRRFVEALSGARCRRVWRACAVSAACRALSRLSSRGRSRGRRHAPWSAEFERDGIPVHPEVIAELRQIGVELPAGRPLGSGDQR
jgi:hypothetical protein